MACVHTSSCGGDGSGIGNAVLPERLSVTTHHLSQRRDPISAPLPESPAFPASPPPLPGPPRAVERRTGGFPGEQVTIGDRGCSLHTAIVPDRPTVRPSDVLFMR